MIAIGASVYGVHVAPGAIGALTQSISVASLAFACLGYAVATVIRSAESAQPVTLAITLPLAFISGVYIPSPSLSPVLRQVAQVFPLQHLVAALGRGFLPGSTAIPWGDLAILAAWGMGGLVVALTRFSWTPAAIKA